jgi:hypothetical protein
MWLLYGVDGGYLDGSSQITALFVSYIRMI